MSNPSFEKWWEFTTQNRPALSLAVREECESTYNACAAEYESRLAAIRAEVEAEMVEKAVGSCLDDECPTPQEEAMAHKIGRLRTDPHYWERRELEARISAYKAINEIIKSCGEVDRDGEYIFREDDFLELFDNEQHGAELELADLPKVEVKS